MRQLKYRLPWLSADYSGASGAFYEMNGMTIMCDPGACTGNIMGYDEPRLDLNQPFYSMQIGQSQAVFGFDRELLEKAGIALRDRKPECFLLLGTPISATLAEDYRGLAGKLSAETGIPGFGIDTSGIDTYEVGERKLMQELADRMISRETDGSVDVNVLGATPLNMWDVNQVNDLIDLLRECGFRHPSVWGRNGKLPEIRQAAGAKLNLAVSVSAIPVVKELQRRYGTPYLIGFPIGRRQTACWREKLRQAAEERGKKTLQDIGKAAEKAVYRDRVKERREGRALIVGEQVSACALRDCLRSETGYQEVRICSFFGMETELLEPGDRRLTDEETLEDAAQEGYDLVICDPLMYPVLSYRPAHTMPWPHTAVSGRLYLSRGANIFGEKGSDYILREISPDRRKENA